MQRSSRLRMRWNCILIFSNPNSFNFVLTIKLRRLASAPIGSPTRPDRDKTPDDTVDIEDPVIVKIAKRLNVHPAVICVKWAVQRGQIPIPFSVHPNEYWSNLKAAMTEPLTDEEMQEIAGIDKNNRLIKGQVFLWESAKDWQDLWDLDGQIASHVIQGIAENMASQFILTVDVGTSSTKTSLWTEAGQLVAHASSTYNLQRAEPLWAEIDGDTWWQAVCETIQTVLAKSGVDPASIAGIGVDGVGWTLIPVDRRRESSSACHDLAGSSSGTGNDLAQIASRS